MAKGQSAIAAWAQGHARRLSWPPADGPQALSPLSILDADLAGARAQIIEIG